ncbi:MAG: ROK family glucokinase [Lachnospiraceae bacterium]|nr:ROK family glucokinase [Lachnospiraceae bacterium]MCI7040704.1 ROK family glucokinase [Lachnospiraceae bacterium]MCI7191304.1 ROK family glucokinase [Lachnospiraceae bacterium]MDD7628965.1 ROK family glucokinase [Lachnospiraceae bacterium]MDY4117639.1 ROK family glucokinase [Lachnospiraceae bacterium]
MKKYVFGVDIGGTTVKLGLFDVEGNVLDKWEIPTRTENGGEKILPDIADSIREKMKQIDKDFVAGVGVGAPGPVDGKGIVHRAVNLGWGTFSIKDTLEDLLNMPVMAGNDANVAALGEMWMGGGQGYRDLVVVTLGTGVGGGIIIDGKMLTGATGAGGEIGHIHVNDEEEEICGCGNKGCLEQYSSATGITRLANQLLASSDKDSVLRGGEVSAKTVFDAVKERDPLAVEVAEKFGKYLGDGLASIACVVNPEAIVIGGGVSKAGEILIDFIRPHYEKNVFHGSRQVKFSLATLGNDAGIYGAAKLVLDAVENK